MRLNCGVYEKRLKDAREHRGLTQTELAKLAGVSQSTVGNLEAGRNKSSTHTATFAAVLRCNVHWLATGEGDPEYDSGQDVDFILSHYRNFDDARRQAILDYIRILETLGPDTKPGAPSSPGERRTKHK